MASPTQRTLEYLRGEGYVAQIVEKYNSFAKVRIDLFGFIDIIAIRGDETLGVQATSSSNISARIAKAKEQPHFREWCIGKNRTFAVIGWEKRCKDGVRGARKVWTMKMQIIGSL